MTKIDDSKLQMLGKVRRIVTHGGLPHMDDIMACAIAYASGVAHDAVIERRNPKPGELESMTVLVLDVGGASVAKLMCSAVLGSILAACFSRSLAPSLWAQFTPVKSDK